ncbi:MAG: glycoside hydrolase family 127 protein [Thermofilaceae archaeon]|nr:glycoside hydrolase family 127 protein [Thermofilaceae archaeon]
MRTVVVDSSRSAYAKLKPVPLDDVRLQDSFWAPRIQTLLKVTIPTQYRLLEETGRLDNFRRAAGKVSGPFRGLVFNDSDVYKWIEAASYALAYEYDSHVERMVDQVAEEVAAAQDEDGYLNTYFTFEKRNERWKNLRDLHEMYCAGHLFQAAVARHRAQGKRDLLDVSLRFADHIYKVFGPEGREGVDGHPEVEMALVELYREVGRREYLELAHLLIERRGKGLIGGSPYHLDHLPFKRLSELTGHAVRALYLCCGAADVYMETGDSELREALERLWRDLVERKMYVTGGVGSRYEGEAIGEAYELPNERAYAETCAAVANVMWNWRMLLATGEARFADVMELALYNGALAGISLSGDRYFYVNPLADRGGHRRQTWFECACCPPNIARLIAYTPAMIYAKSVDGIYLNLYAANKARIELEDGSVYLEQRTVYPWEGVVEVKVKPEGLDEFPLFLRIPGWTRKARVEVNGRGLEHVNPGSYVKVERRWREGDVVRLVFEMGPLLLEAHPHVTYNTCRVAIRHGPLIYCLEQPDNVYDVWDLAIVPGQLDVEWRPDLLGGVNVVKGAALYFDSSKWAGRLYAPAGSVEVTPREVEFKAIPYYSWANREPGPMIVWVKRTQ